MLILYLLFVVVVIFAIKKATLHKIQNAEFPYVKKDYLLSIAEKDFYFILQKTFGSDYLLFSKVRISDLLYLPKMSNSNFYHYQNKIQSKHIDFLLCDKENIRPLLVIELDDSSHLKTDRILRDMLVDRIFKSADLPILHIRTASSYNANDLLKQVQDLLSITNQTITTNSN